MLILLNSVRVHEPWRVAMGIFVVCMLHILFITYFVILSIYLDFIFNYCIMNTSATNEERYYMPSVARVIFEQIRISRTKDGTNGTKAMFCWGARQLTSIENGAAFRVSGLKFKGIIEIRLNSHDLYDIHFIKTGKLKEASTGVFCDQLTGIIDSFVEG